MQSQPLSPFAFFSVTKRADLVEKNRSWSTQKVTQEVARLWKETDASEKQAYALKMALDIMKHADTTVLEKLE